MDDLTPGPIDPILRFVNVTWLWIVIVIVNLVFVDQICYLFIGEYPESQFLDMCVIAKISVFIRTSDTTDTICIAGRRTNMQTPTWLKLIRTWPR